MKISQMGVRRILEKVQDRGSWYLVSLQYRMFQCIEYGRWREHDASEGVTTEYFEVRHGMTGWIDY